MLPRNEASEAFPGVTLVPCCDNCCWAAAAADTFAEELPAAELLFLCEFEAWPHAAGASNKLQHAAGKTALPNARFLIPCISPCYATRHVKRPFRRAVESRCEHWSKFLPWFRCTGIAQVCKTFACGTLDRSGASFLDRSGDAGCADEHVPCHYEYTSRTHRSYRLRPGRTCFPLPLRFRCARHGTRSYRAAPGR